MSVEEEVHIKQEVNSEDEDQPPTIVDMEKLIKVEINEDVVASSNDDGVDPLEHSQEIDTSKFLEVQYSQPNSSSHKLDFNKKIIRYETMGNGPKKVQAQKMLEEKLRATLMEQRRLQMEIAALKRSEGEADIDIASKRTIYNKTVKLKMKGPNDFYQFHAISNQGESEEKKLARRKLKVDSERGRRQELKEHYDNLYYWVNLGKTDNIDYKQSYHDRMISAIECIKEMEKEVIEKEEEYEKLWHVNNELSIKLMELSPDTPFQPKKDQFLYPCESPHCRKIFKSVKPAFVHQQCNHADVDKEPIVPTYMKMKVDDSKHDKEKSIAKEIAAVKEKRILSYEKKTLSSFVLKCRHCSTITNDKTVLHLHSLLHKQLTYFKCPHELCSRLFGVPSKLKTHHFLVHESVLSSEDECVLSQEARVDLTNTIIAYLSFTGKLDKDKECLSDIDNFLEASLDATLIKDEMDMQQEIDHISEEELQLMFQEELQSMTKINSMESELLEEKDPLS